VEEEVAHRSQQVVESNGTSSTVKRRALAGQVEYVVDEAQQAGGGGPNGRNHVALVGVERVVASTSLMPMTALSGVRNSWLMG
jgi:hypothetical protein